MNSIITFLTKDSTDVKSHSWMLLIISYICLISAGALEMAGVVHTTSVFPELFMTCSALYFGRRFANSKSGSSLDQAGG